MKKSDFPIDQTKTYIIAEAEINHNGKLQTALQMISTAKEIGADAIKFQYIIAEEICSKDSAYYDLFKKAELSHRECKTVMQYAEEKNIDCFFTSPSNNTLLKVIDLKPKFIKIGSTNISNIPLLKNTAKTGIPVILSTGMATLGEIETGLELLTNIPVCLLHCAVRYPAEPSSLNLRAIATMKTVFPMNLIGYSDHSEGEQAAVAAITLGAKVIEKHFTLDKTDNGPDHHFSADPTEFKNMVHSIRTTEIMLGDGIKKPSELEIPNIVNARRYIVALKNIPAGDRITKSHIDCRRVKYVEGDIGSASFDLMVGWKSPKNYKTGETLNWNHIKNN